MKKSELKNGMGLITRGGTKYIVLDEHLVRDKGWMPLRDYTEDLLCPDEVFPDKETEWDIVAVYQVQKQGIFSWIAGDADTFGKLLWERKKAEPERMITAEELEQIKDLADEVGKVAGKLYAKIHALEAKETE